jgi:hypothetical protein
MRTTKQERRVCIHGGKDRIEREAEARFAAKYGIDTLT